MRTDWLVDTTNKNSHAGIERVEEAEKASALLGLVNEYRVYTQRFETLPTWDILEFLQKLDNELNEAERDKIKEQYFLLTHKKPFLWWSNERILEEMEKYKENQTILSEHTLDSKKSRWNKALKK